MEYIYKEFSYLENRFRSWIEWSSDLSQILWIWVKDNAVWLGALVFLVAVVWIASKYVILPKEREGP
jgi:hypothetical protein